MCEGRDWEGGGEEERQKVPVGKEGWHLGA